MPIEPALWQHRFLFESGKWSEWIEGRATGRVHPALSEERPLYTEAQVKAREAAAWEAGREASAGVAGQAHMVPPDGGSPTEDERAVAVAAESAIRTLVNPHGEK